MHVHGRAKSQAPRAHGRVEVRVRDDNGLDAAQLLHRLQLANSRVSCFWDSLGIQEGFAQRYEHAQVQVKKGFRTGCGWVVPRSMALLQLSTDIQALMRPTRDLKHCSGRTAVLKPALGPYWR